MESPRIWRLWGWCVPHQSVPHVIRGARVLIVLRSALKTVPVDVKSASLVPDIIFSAYILAAL